MGDSTAAQVRLAARLIAERAGALAPRIAMVLGSGLSGLARSLEDAVVVPYSELPGFPSLSVGGHAAELLIGRLEGIPLAMLRGREHFYEHGSANAMRVPVRALRNFGCEVLLLTNAAGSLNVDAAPGSLMLISDHLNLTGANPLIGEDRASADHLPRFVDLTNAYDADLRAVARDVARAEGIELHEGVYAFFSGPSFETPAEVRAAGVLGASAVGMSTAPETVLARQCGMRVAAFSVITNFAAGIDGSPLSHEETLAQSARAAHAAERLAAGIVRAVDDLAAERGA
ncbi:MAG: purine-nucleoside phosphorylase [Gammaproteobacteria bacterium]